MWRGRDWKSQFSEEEKFGKSEIESTSITSHPEGQVNTNLHCSSEIAGSNNVDISPSPFVGEVVDPDESKKLRVNMDEDLLSGISDDIPSCSGSTADGAETLTKTSGTIAICGGPEEIPSDANNVAPQTCNEVQDVCENRGLCKTDDMKMHWMEGVIMLRNKAIEGGSAVLLEKSCLDADIVYERAVTLAKSAPKGPAFEKRPRKASVKKDDASKVGGEVEAYASRAGAVEAVDTAEIMVIPEKGRSVNKSLTNQRKKSSREDFSNIVPRGSLRVDELAKLLA